MFYLIHWLIKFFSRNMCIAYISIKIIDYPNLSKIKKLLLLITALSLATLQYFLQNYTSTIYRILIIYLIYSLILGKLTKTSIGHSILITTISLAISYCADFISTAIVSLIISTLLHISRYNIMILLIISCIDFAIIYSFFKIKRFKHGFSFIKNKAKNDYLDIFVLVINAAIICTRFVLSNLSNLTTIYFIMYFSLFILIMIIITQKTFVLYQKHNILTKTLKDYEQELQETQQKLQTALEEKQKLVKSNHEFYHRQEALKKKLDDLINQHSIEMNSEFGEDYSDILDRINNLSDEYSSKIKTLPKLPQTKIAEIDDMLSYMQSECDKNNIEFILKIECDVHHILNNYITKSQLETLLGDLLRNSIIAINHTSNTFRSIMVVFGIKDDSYELCVLDSGIPFEITTLLKLGLQPASTHESEGGTGIGFITTFETLSVCNASLIINEVTNNNYSKSLEIKFDGKHAYTIISNREKEINTLNGHKRTDIIIKGCP